MSHSSNRKEELIVLNKNVVKLLGSSMWDLATCAERWVTSPMQCWHPL